MRSSLRPAIDCLADTGQVSQAERSVIPEVVSLQV